MRNTKREREEREVRGGNEIYPRRERAQGRAVRGTTGEGRKMVRKKDGQRAQKRRAGGRHGRREEDVGTAIHKGR